MAVVGEEGATRDEGLQLSWACVPARGTAADVQPCPRPGHAVRLLHSVSPATSPPAPGSLRTPSDPEGRRGPLLKRTPRLTTRSPAPLFYGWGD